MSVPSDAQRLCDLTGEKVKKISSRFKLCDTILCLLVERGPLAPSSTEDGNLPSRILRIADLKGSTRHVCLRAIGNFLTSFARLVRYRGYCNTNRNFYAEHKRASQTRSKPSFWCGRRVSKQKQLITVFVQRSQQSKELKE